MTPLKLLFCLFCVIKVATGPSVREPTAITDRVRWIFGVEHLLLGALADDRLVSNLVVHLCIKLADHLGLSEIHERAVVVKRETLFSRVVFLEKVCVSNASQFRIWDATFPGQSASDVK